MSNLTDLLEKASVILTPTAHAYQKMFAVKPVKSFATGDLITNGGYDADTDWTKSTGCSISGGVASFDGTQNAPGGTLSQSLTTEVNQHYEISFEIVSFTQGNALSVQVGFDGGSGSTVVSSGVGAVGVHKEFLQSNGNDTFKIYVNSGGKNPAFIGSIDNVSVRKISKADFNAYTTTASTRVGPTGLIETVAAYIPRVDYLGGTGHLLLEAPTTNTATYSNDFTQGDIFNSSGNPFLQSATLTANQVTSPEGTNNAWLLQDNSGSGTGLSEIRFNNVTVTSNDFNTVAIFVKKALTNNFFSLASLNYDSSGSGASWFNISNGTLGTIDSNHTAKIEDYGNGWYRCQITFKTTTDVGGGVRIRLADTDGSTNVTLDGTNGVYLFGLQCEAAFGGNKYATSYVPTSGSTVSRNGDTLTCNSLLDLINSSEGVLYIEAAVHALDTNSRSISLNDDSTSNQISLEFDETTNRLKASIGSGGASVELQHDASDLTQFNKIAVKYKANDFALWFNGSEVATNAETPSMPTGMFQFIGRAGAFSASSGTFRGKIKCIAVYKEALTDAQLTALTT